MIVYALQCKKAKTFSTSIIRDKKNPNINKFAIAWYKEKLSLIPL